MTLRHVAAIAALAFALSACATRPVRHVSGTPEQAAVSSEVTDGVEASATANTARVEAGDSTPATDATTDATVTATAKPSAPTDAAGEAEADFNVLYGNAEGDDSVDGGVVSQIRDPWEKYNRKVHEFNNVIDRAVLRPVAKAYIRVVPRPIRTGISNFFRNLSQPITVINALLQGKPDIAANATMRFALNSTFGLGGLFDPASKINIPSEQEDFGQTLGTWGWKQSRYVELPMFGPRTLRDVVGMVVDRPLNPTRHFDPESQTGLGVLQVVDIRTQLLSVDSMREGAADDYLLYRDSWMQRRSFQIFGDDDDDDKGVPAYLLTAPVPMAEMAKPAPTPKKNKKIKPRRGVSRPPAY